MPTKKHLMQSMIHRSFLGFQYAWDNLQEPGPSRYKVILFEDLVTEPANQISEICDFVGIENSEKFNTPSTFGYLWSGNNFDGKQFNTVNAENVGKWRERISDEDAMLIEYFLRDGMKRFNYMPVFSSVEMADQARQFYKWSNFSYDWSEK